MAKANQLTFFCILIGARVLKSVAFFLPMRLLETTMDSRLINVYLLGLAMMILNIAFQTSRMLQVAVNLHIHEISFFLGKCT